MKAWCVCSAKLCDPYLSANLYIYLFTVYRPTVYRHEHASAVHELRENYTGTGHVVFGGAFYYHRDRSPEVIRYDLTRKTITGRITLADAEYDNDNYLYASEFNYVDLAADENGLWAVYASAASNNHGSL